MTTTQKIEILKAKIGNSSTKPLSSAQIMDICDGLLEVMSDVANTVTLDTEQTIEGVKTFETGSLKVNNLLDANGDQLLTSVQTVGTEITGVLPPAPTTFDFSTGYTAGLVYDPAEASAVASALTSLVQIVGNMYQCLQNHGLLKDN